MLTAYIDESYNQRVMCVGGWMCTDGEWKLIEEPWLARIEHESKISMQRGLKPLRRYHASDCSNFHEDVEGWDKPRQIRFVKKLLRILEKVKPVGIVCGSKISDYVEFLPELQDGWEKNLYITSMIGCLKEIVEYVTTQHPGERVTIIHDRKKGFHHIAERSFEYVKATFPHARDVLLTIASGCWEDFPALQPADLIAFDGFKSIDNAIQGYSGVRKSLEKMLGSGFPLIIGYFSPSLFSKLRDVRSEILSERGVDIDI